MELLKAQLMPEISSHIVPKLELEGQTVASLLFPTTSLTASWQLTALSVSFAKQACSVSGWVYVLFTSNPYVLADENLTGCAHTREREIRRRGHGIRNESTDCGSCG